MLVCWIETLIDSIGHLGQPRRRSRSVYGVLCSISRGNHSCTADRLRKLQE